MLRDTKSIFEQRNDQYISQISTWRGSQRELSGNDVPVVDYRTLNHHHKRRILEEYQQELCFVAKGRLAYRREEEIWCSKFFKQHCSLHTRHAMADQGTLSVANPDKLTIADAIQRAADEKSSTLKLTEYLRDESIYQEIIAFPLNVFKQCAPFLTVLELNRWPLDPASQSYGLDVVNTFPSEIFNHLPNLQKLSMSCYPFPFISDDIGNLSNLRYLNLYGSRRLLKLPRTIGKCTKLTTFCPYTSYRFHYVPFEIKECPLKDTTMSTRALYNNFKNKMHFPPLPIHPKLNGLTALTADLKGYLSDLENVVLPQPLILNIIGFLPITFCSVCKELMFEDYTHYVWSHEMIGTDRCGVLGRMCSVQCIQRGVPKKRHYFSAETSRNESCSDPIEHDDEATYFGITEDLYGDVSPAVSEWEIFWRQNLGIEYESFKLVSAYGKSPAEMNVTFDGRQLYSEE